jgi:hypothetical protein
MAAVLVVTGVQLAHLYATSGVASCHTNCRQLVESFLRQARNGTTGTVFYLGVGVVYAVPAIIGVFWGAPLIARELEAGTHRLVWNQSVTRGRWLAAKLVGVGLASMAAAGLLSLMVTWWASPIDKASQHRLTPDIFGARGVVPIGYAAFAFALGVTIGVLVRRTVPAMGVTLAVVIAAQIAMPLWVRAHLIAPVHATSPLDTSSLDEFSMSERGRMSLTGQPKFPGAWITSNETITSTGAVFVGPADPTACGRDLSPERCIAWINTLHLRQVVDYQPASRFWPLQWYELSIFLTLAALLAGFCVWWVRRRLT